MTPALVIATYYLTFELALPSSILRITRWDVDMLCTVVARSPCRFGNGSVTIEALMSDGSYACFTLKRVPTVGIISEAVLVMGAQ